MKIWKILNPFILQEKACSEENIRMWLSNYLIEIMGTTHGLDQPFQQKPGVQMGSYQQKRCQFELKGTEKNKMKSKLSDFLDPTEPTRVICPQTCIILQEKKTEKGSSEIVRAIPSVSATPYIFRGESRRQGRSPRESGG